MKIADFFRSYYVPLRLLGRSPRTIVLYQYTIKLFSEYLGRDAELSDLNDLSVAGHLVYLNQQGRKPAGVNKERAQLLAIWRFAARKKMVNEFPEVRKLPEPESIPKAWTMEELWRLKMSCKFAPGIYHGVPADKWWLALHAVLWTTGERIGAVRRAKWSDLVDDSISFPAANRKGQRKANICQLPDYALDALEEIRHPHRELIFPFPYTETYLYQLYNKILKRAELDTDCQSKFHRMRRSHATHLKIAGGDPTASLGHANAATTARYIDLRQIPNNTVKLLPKIG